MSNPNSSLEINVTSPYSPLLTLQIHHFIKDVNIPIKNDIETENSIITGGGEKSNKDTSLFGYFKSFFQNFSQQTLQEKKHETKNKSYMNSLFYSGNEKKEEIPKSSDPDPDQEMEIESKPIQKIILSTEVDLNIKEALKGTKLYYLAERSQSTSPTNWV
jgi:hypothetical protein